MKCSKILVVDDFEPFRQVVGRMLQPRAEFQVIGQASDGLEAVQRAQELQPDLILLDTSLPKLNGFEVGRRIRELCPNSKVLVCSLDPSTEMVQEALRLGAQGYLLKVDVAGELLLALDAVLRGRLFVSSSLDRSALTRLLDERLADRPRPVERLASPPSRRHDMVSYPDDSSFVDDFVRFIERAAKNGQVVIVIANELHRRKIFERLQGHGWDLSAAIQQGRFIFLDVNDALSMFMVNDWPDAVRLRKAMEDLLGGAAKPVPERPPRIAVCGEGTSTLWAQGKLETAIQLEHLWDQVARSRDMDILCGYPLSARQSKESQAWQRMCAEHSDIHVWTLPNG